MNLERSFAFAFKAPGAGKKLALGGLFTLLFFTVFLPIVATGYVMRVLYDALEGRDAKLPNWTNFKNLFNEGLLPVLIILVYSSPFILLLVLEQLIYTILGWNFGLIGLFFILRLIIALGLSMFIPLALIRFAVLRSLRSAFDLNRIYVFIKTNPGRLFTAWSLSIALTMLGTLGLIVFVVGVFFTYFIASVIIVHLFAQAYRASTPFDDDKDGKIRSSMTIPPPLH